MLLGWFLVGEGLGGLDRGSEWDWEPPAAKEASPPGPTPGSYG